jgi:3-keto-5-aminohexanoate cleavage enzyme
MSKKVIITAAVIGSRPTKEMNPAVPYTPEEIAREAIACHRAGASIAHIHVRNPQTGAPESRLELFEEVVERVRAECDILINLTTSGLDITGPDALERRLDPIQLKPEICSLDIGSLNFQDRLFANPPDFGEEAARRMLSSDVKPEIEVFDPGHISQAVHLMGQGAFAAPPYFQLCMGIRWGIEATLENLIFMKSKLPPGVEWSVLGVGRHQLTMITGALLLGGHVRVGFEDNLYLSKGVLAKSNADFVERAVRLAGELQREVAKPAETRAMLGID